MYCPKCALHNADDSKFCRGCGADLSNVLAVVDGQMPQTPASAQEHILLSSTGVRNIVLAFFIFALSLLVFTMPGNTYYWVLVMLPGIPLFASGVTRIMKADGLKALQKSGKITERMFPPQPATAALPPVQTEYVKPTRSIYQTDDLATEPASITEDTTRHLQMESEVETTNLPEK